MIEHSSGYSFKLLTESRLRLGLTLIIVLMVISSQILILANPASAISSSSTDNSILGPSTISQDGSDFTTQAALSSLTARPTNNIVNTNSFYDVVFLTATAGAIKTIQVTFPAGTTIPSGAFFNEAEKCVPGSDCTEMTGTASKSGQTIIYTITNAVNIPAGTKIRLEFANINNPLVPSASYQVTVTTRNAVNAVIDGPSATTAYTIKQIGTAELADDTITEPKIADNAVTTPKIADGAIVPDTTTVFADVEISVPPQTLGSSNAFCPSTHPHATGGGITTQSGSEAFMNLSDSFGTSGAWTANMFNTHPSTTFNFRATVTCMADMP
jgi:hypothetical protein